MWGRGQTERVFWQEQRAKAEGVLRQCCSRHWKCRLFKSML